MFVEIDWWFLYNGEVMDIKLATTQAEFFALVQLRKDVFVNEQSVDVNLEMDKEDLTAWHFIAVENGEVIATCRLVVHHRQGKLGRFAVAAPYRHRAIGSQLINFVEEQAKSSGLTEIILGAQTHAIDFYLANGYSVCSDVFDDAGIPHKMMNKKL